MLACLLPKQKAPGKDGLPIKLFLVLWDQVGPILLKVLEDGIVKGIFHPQVTIGMMLLLAWKGDQSLISNKRGITLLNMALKILAKASQLRLAKVLHDLILEQKSAFLLGRSIH